MINFKYQLSEIVFLYWCFAAVIGWLIWSVSKLKSKVKQVNVDLQTSKTSNYILIEWLKMEIEHAKSQQLSPREKEYLAQSQDHSLGDDEDEGRPEPLGGAADQIKVDEVLLMGNKVTRDSRTVNLRPVINSTEDQFTRVLREIEAVK